MITGKFFIQVLKKTRLLKYFNLATAVEVNGKQFLIPIAYSIGYNNILRNEVWLSVILKKLGAYLGGDRSFIDVGVNVGQTLLLLKSLYPQTPYYGFEPNPVCVLYANNLIEKNRVVNANIFPFGLSDRNAIVDLIFFLEYNDDSTASVIQGFRKDDVKRLEKVSLFNFDGLPEGKTFRPGIVKIDVEGGELEVIKGMAALIQKERPSIVCEVLPTYGKENVFRLQRQEEFQNIMSAKGYSLYHISGDGETERTDSFYSNANVEACNYLFLPSENDIFS
jgi:FkbM family methyltransferase